MFITENAGIEEPKKNPTPKNPKQQTNPNKQTPPPKTTQICAYYSSEQELLWTARVGSTVRLIRVTWASDKAKCERSKIDKRCYCFVLLSPQLLIKLKTKTNTDYFLECCSREERDSWALDITGAIHAGHPVQVQELHRMKNSFKLLENISLQ